MLPNKCSIREKEKNCVNPPEFIISVATKSDEYMLGVTCTLHKDVISKKIMFLQHENKIPQGKVNFAKLKSIGTDCVKGNADDLIQL